MNVGDDDKAFMKIKDCFFPGDVLHDLDENVWVRRDINHAIVRITCLYSAISGRINKIKINKPLGTFLEPGKSVATVESSKVFGAVRTPINGKLIEINK